MTPFESVAAVSAALVVGTNSKGLIAAGHEGAVAHPFVKVDGDNQGIEFDFANASITSLAPRDRLLVVEDVAAFEFRYGDDLPVAGSWSGGLSNGGEQLTLIDNGITVQQFTKKCISFAA